MKRCTSSQAPSATCTDGDGALCATHRRQDSPWCLSIVKRRRKTNAAWIATFTTTTLVVSNIMCGMRHQWQDQTAGQRIWDVPCDQPVTRNKLRDDRKHMSEAPATWRCCLCAACDMPPVPHIVRHGGQSRVQTRWDSFRPVVFPVDDGLVKAWSFTRKNQKRRKVRGKA